MQTFKQVLTKSSLSPRSALQEFLMLYRRTPLSLGYSPSELLNGRQIRSKIDVLLPSPAHIALVKQAKEATKSQMTKDGDQVEKVATIFKIGTLCYALYFGPRRDKDPKWVPAIGTKVFSFRSVQVRVFPKGVTWRRHQLRPWYTSQEDTEPGEPPVFTQKEVDQSLLGETPEVSVQVAQQTEPVTTPALPRQKHVYRNPRQPTGEEYGPGRPRRSQRHKK